MYVRYEEVYRTKHVSFFPYNNSQYFFYKLCPAVLFSPVSRVPLRDNYMWAIKRFIPCGDRTQASPTLQPCRQLKEYLKKVWLEGPMTDEHKVFEWQTLSNLISELSMCWS